MGRYAQMKYMSTSEAGQKWGISKRRVIVLCKEERIPGAQMAGRNWIIPEDVEKPADARIKSGRYIKQNQGDATKHGSAGQY